MINVKHIVLNSWKISHKKYITWVALIKVSNGELVCGFKFKYLSYFNLYILIFNWSSALIWFCCCCVLRFPPRPEKKNIEIIGTILCSHAHPADLIGYGWCRIPRQGPWSAVHLSHAAAAAGGGAALALALGLDQLLHTHTQ